MLFIVFTVGYISIFMAYIFLQMANKHVNHSALVFLSLALAIIGGLEMLNYEGKTVEIHRYIIGQVLLNASYGIGRPAVLK